MLGIVGVDDYIFKITRLTQLPRLATIYRPVDALGIPPSTPRESRSVKSIWIIGMCLDPDDSTTTLYALHEFPGFSKIAARIENSVLGKGVDQVWV